MTWGKLFENRWIKSALSLIFVGLFTRFLYNQRAELAELPALISNVNPYYLLAGFLVMGVSFFMQGVFFQSCIESIGKHIPLVKSVELYVKRFFVSTFIPAGFSVSQYTFAGELKKYGLEILENHLASCVYLLITAIAFIFLLAPTILVLSFFNKLTLLASIGSIVIIVGTIFLVFEFFLFLRQKGIFYPLISRIYPDLPDFIAKRERKTFYREGIYKAFVAALAYYGIGSLLMYVAFLAFGVSASYPLAALSYVVTVAVLIVSPIFQGLGLVEFALVGFLSLFGIAAPAALAVTLFYRLFQMWLPLLIGLLFYTRKKVTSEFVSLM